MTVEDGTAPRVKVVRRRSPEFEASVIEQMQTMAALFRTNGEQTQATVVEVAKRVEEAFKAQDETLVLLRSTVDVMEDFLANLDATVDKLVTATAALVQVQNNLIALMQDDEPAS